MSDIEGVFQPLCDWYRRNYELLCTKYQTLLEKYRNKKNDYNEAVATVHELATAVNEAEVENLHHRRLAQLWEQRARDFARQYDDLVYMNRSPESEHHPRSLYTTYFEPISSNDSTESEDLLEL